MSDKVPGTPFAKGDPRINRKGRPKTFDALRQLAQQIAHEPAKKGDIPIEIDGHIVTVTEAIMRTWAQSKDPRLVQAFIAYAYGKPPDKTEVTGKDGGPLELKGNIDNTVVSKLLPELAVSDEDKQAK
jgi:hypothetical protein